MKTKFYISQKSWDKHEFSAPCWETDTNISFSTEMDVMLPISKSMFCVTNICIDYTQSDEPIQHVNLTFY